MTLGIRALLVSGLALMSGASAEPLENLRWKNRVVLLFGPTDVSLGEKQMAAWDADAQGLVDRDIVVIPVADSSHREAFEKRFEISSDTFAVILIGKDGGEKLRTSDLLSNEALFAVIDAMPMRQREMREQGE